MAGRCETHYRSPIGILKITGTLEGIMSIDFLDTAPDGIVEIPECLAECISQLDEYFKGTRREFSLKLALEGTCFQKKVWAALCNIPHGCTTSYGDIAAAVGNPKASRAVGNANNKNSIPIIIPCHRVIGIDGRLTGYAGGLWRKEWLLSHEKNLSPF